MAITRIVGSLFMAAGYRNRGARPATLLTPQHVAGKRAFSGGSPRELRARTCGLSTLAQCDQQHERRRAAAGRAAAIEVALAGRTREHRARALRVARLDRARS